MVHDVCSKSHEFPGDVDKFLVIRRVLGDMYSFLRRATRYGHIFARGFYQLSADCNFELPEDLEFISWVEEAYGAGALAELLKPFSKNAFTLG